MRKLISGDEAQQATKQLTAPCSDCPWRRDAVKGWLGDLSPQEWVEAAHGETVIDCHAFHGTQCAGASVYRANVCKSPRYPEIVRLPADREAVFASHTEFLEHHKGSHFSRAPNPLAEICGKCGNWIRTIGQPCEWDDGVCHARGRK